MLRARALALGGEEADPVAASEASAAADEAARAARAVAAVEEPPQRIEGDVATLTANVALFSRHLAAAGEEPAEVLANEVLVDMLPSLRESQPRVLRLIEGGEVEDEGLVERLFALHEQLGYCVGKYDELAGAATAAAGPPLRAPAGAALARRRRDLRPRPALGSRRGQRRGVVPVAAAPSLAAATAGAIASASAGVAPRGRGPLTTRGGEGGAPSDDAHGPPPTEPPPPRRSATAGRRRGASDRAGGAASVGRPRSSPGGSGSAWRVCRGTLKRGGAQTARRGPRRRCLRRRRAPMRGRLLRGRSAPRGAAHRGAGLGLAAAARIALVSDARRPRARPRRDAPSTAGRAVA